MMSAAKITPAMTAACKVLDSAGSRGMTPSEFARVYWPDKVWQRINGPWGLGPDASGLHGGRMLTRLQKAGLARLQDHGGYYTAHLNAAGRALTGQDSEATG